MPDFMCPHCDGHQLSTLDIKLLGEILPAKRCGHCGGLFFAGDVVDRLLTQVTRLSKLVGIVSAGTTPTPISPQGGEQDLLDKLR